MDGAGCHQSYGLISSRLLSWLIAQSEPLSRNFPPSKKRDSESCPLLHGWGERPSSDLSVEPKAWPFAEFGATLIGYLGSRVS